MNGPTDGPRSNSSHGLTSMSIVTRSGVVALVAAVVTAGVVAVTGTSAEQDSPPPSTTTTTPAPTPAADQDAHTHPESQIGFTCMGDARAVLVEARSSDPHAAAAAMSAEIGAPVLVVDTDACEFQRSPYRAPAPAARWLSQVVSPAVDLFVGQFTDVGEACEVELAVFQDLVAAGEGRLSGMYKHIRVAQAGKRAAEPTDCVETRKWTSLARGEGSGKSGLKEQGEEEDGN